ncbi:MAG: flagellar basal body-associated FliL family protein [Spirochaetaceae bacterium]
MADDEVFSGEGIDESPEQEGEKRGGFIPAVLLKILKYVALGLAAIIFIVTVVVLTVNFLDSGPQAEAYPGASPDYSNVTPVLSWYDLQEIRGRTDDETPHTVIIDAKIGYEKDNTRVQTELIARKEQIIDMMRRFFASYKSSELEPRHEEEIKAKLKENINGLMGMKGAVKDIAFLQFNVIEF